MQASEAASSEIVEDVEVDEEGEVCKDSNEGLEAPVNITSTVVNLHSDFIIYWTEHSWTKILYA